MQALLRFGHAHLRDSCFLLLTIKDASSAGAWLQSTRISSAVASESPPSSALQVAFTATGLSHLGLSEEVLGGFSNEFYDGMSSDEGRSRRLGDINQNAPQNWVWGYHDSHQLHVLLLLYTRTGELDSLTNVTQTALFNQAFVVLHTLPTDTLGSREPFGFIDGISQPVIDWDQRQRTDWHSRDRYSNLLAPGEIVLGYQNEYGQLTSSPLVDKSHTQLKNKLSAAVDHVGIGDFGQNGSYIVLRQLEQAVERFQSYLHQQYPSDKNAADQLASLMVGRTHDGDALVPVGKQKIPGITSSQSQNHFTYDNDPLGHRCPISSHIRRSNPRTGDFPPGLTGRWSRLIRQLGFGRQSDYEDLIASSRFHRILRRGRTYGGDVPIENASQKTPSTARGLQFMCLASNISRQFEFVQSAWSTSSTFAGLHGQRDPLIAHRGASGSGAATDSFSYPTETGVQHKVVNLPQFVTVRGGAYFFMPGLKAIGFLAELAQQSANDTTSSDSTV